MWNLTWAVPATIFVAVIWWVSAIANYSFGTTQGTSEIINLWLFTTTSAQANGLASLAVDGLQAIMPAMVVVFLPIQFLPFGDAAPAAAKLDEV